MHIPENYLSPSTCGVFAVAMVPVWMRAVRHVREEVPRQKMPLVGVAAAFCFLAMMFTINHISFLRTKKYLTNAQSTFSIQD